MSIPEAATLALALDCLGAGLFIVEGTSHIVHANASGQVMLGRRSVLRAAGGRVVACEATSAKALKASVSEVAAAPARGGAVLAVPLRASDGEHSIAHILPLALAGQQRAAGHDAGGAALLVHKVGLELPSPPEVIARLYRLTPGELRVLLAIVEVGGVRETAEALGLSEATVKTHLHRLFGKTGATRQADLVKLVAGFANPILGRRSFAPVAQRHPSMESQATRYGPRVGREAPSRCAYTGPRWQQPAPGREARLHQPQLPTPLHG
jgi:DNA-binding CsgD family transcriptional regulator